MNKLVSFEEIGCGNEVEICPATKAFPISTFVPFPIASAGLSPSRPPHDSISAPRFSGFEFDEVILRGFRLFECNGHLFNDQSLVDPDDMSIARFWNKLSLGPHENLKQMPDGSVQSSAQDEIWETIDGTDCLILSSNEPSNFGSWIFRVLTKFMLARRHYRPNRVFVYNAAQWMTSILQLVDPAVEVLHHAPTRTYRISNAVIPSLPAPQVYLRDEIREGFADIAGRIGTRAGLPERVYISRRRVAIRHPGHRVLENETELFERLRIFGFVEFCPEQHDIEHQIAVFAHAELIVSVGGSNLFCAAFASKAKLIIDLESGKDWLYAHCNLLASTQLPFSVVEGVRNDRGASIHANWTIDVDALILGMQQLGVI
jgi:hypothetical protein